ncbi:MAG: uncharacterized protein QOD74_3000, partial [Variibacter sp.]|nr:uncharacterized protein [Variibacter sp.]
MLTSLLGRLVELSTRYAWIVIMAAAVLAASSTWYVARHFSINTDVRALLSSNLSWHNRDLAYRAAFPQHAESLLVVIQGPTPELTEAAANALTSRLQPQTSFFRSVSEAGAGEFFKRNALLYVPADQLGQMTQRLGEATPLVQVMRSDPSLRGLAQALSLALEGVEVGKISLNYMARPLNAISDALENVLSGRPASFSWKKLLDERAAGSNALLRVVDAQPILDYQVVQPGEAATAAIKAAIGDAKLEADFGATALITGPVAIADQELATLREGVWLNAGLSAAIVFVILFLALRSLRIVAAVLLTIAVGLVCATALGLLLVGAFNPISVAFAVLFIGLGADFAIQFSVRYRNERHVNDDIRYALISAGERVGAPLTLAAAAAAAGFLSFLPTSYSGLAQLGLIAGCGMVIAYGLCMTLLPALLRALSPPREPKPLGYASLAFADRFLHRHRIAVIAATSIVTLAGLPSLAILQFDFDPLGLQATNSEAVAGLRELRGGSGFSDNTAQVLAVPSEVATVSKQLSDLPQVATVRSLDSFVPGDQDRKLS